MLQKLYCSRFPSTMFYCWVSALHRVCLLLLFIIIILIQLFISRSLDHCYSMARLAGESAPYPPVGDDVVEFGYYLRSLLNYKQHNLKSKRNSFSLVNWTCLRKQVLKFGVELWTCKLQSFCKWLAGGGGRHVDMLGCVIHNFLSHLPFQIHWMGVYCWKADLLMANDIQFIHLNGCSDRYAADR